METLAYIFVGSLNGFFSTGAGQVLLFYLIYINKMDTKKARQLSLLLMPVISIPTFIYYFKKSDINIIKTIPFVIIAIICGNIGNKIMKKMNPNILNLVSGIFLVTTIGISMWRRK